jgi:iron-sulfur cluster repair protein YtfE (RIC family)
MDKLLKLSQEHGEVFESLAFFKKAMAVVNTEDTPGHIDDLKKFLTEDVLAHFMYEENHIFPKVLKSGSLEAQKIVRELQGEHIKILGKLDIFNDLVAKAGNSPGLAQVKKITGVVKQMVELILPHARKEDRAFFPLVKKLGIKL